MKMSIGMKIGLGFAVACVVLLVFGTISYQNTTLLVLTGDQEKSGAEGIVLVDNIQKQLYNTNAQTRGYIIIGDESYADLETEAAKDLFVQMQSLKKFLLESNIDSAEMSGIETNARELMDYQKEIISLRRDKGFEAARQFMKEKSPMRNRLFETLVRDLNEIDEIIGKNLKNLTEKAHSIESRQEYFTLFGVIAAILIMIGTGIVITVNIASPLKKITVVAEKISDGDLSENISTSERADEVGVLQRSFSTLVVYIGGIAENARQISTGNLSVKVVPKSEKDMLGNSFASMITNLKQQTLDIKDGIQVIASSSTEISASTVQVTAGASETAAAVAETASTMEELKQSAMVTTDKTRIVSDTAQRAVQIALSGEQSVNETIEKMNRIREQMQSLADSTIKLSEQSQTIGEIISSVDDIAEQSNLLAVNASIEAAKAGEQGKGFGVVALEIRNLARQSKQATGQVRGILNEIQKAISAAVMDTEKGSKAVDAGVEQSVSAGKSIRALVEGIEQAAIAASQISSSISQQMAGIDQVATAVDNIKLASSQNVESMDQIKIAAQNIQKLGEGLKGLVEKYRI